MQYVMLHFEIGAAHLCSITEIMLPQQFLCVNRSSILSAFPGSAKAIQYSVNITSSTQCFSSDLV